MRIKDFTDTIRHLTDPFNIPEARRMIQENPALTQEQFKVGGLVEPGVTHYAKKGVDPLPYLHTPVWEDITDRAVKDYNKNINKAINKKNLSGIDQFSDFVRTNKKYKKDAKSILVRFQNYGASENLISLNNARKNLLQELVTNANAGDKFVYKKNFLPKLGITNPVISRNTHPQLLELWRSVDSSEDKARKVFSKLLKGDYPLELSTDFAKNFPRHMEQGTGFIKKVIAEKTGLQHATTIREGIKSHKWFKNKKNAALFQKASQTKLGDFAGLKLEDAFEWIRTRAGGSMKWKEANKLALPKDPKNWVMNSALRHFDQNNYRELKSGDIRLFNRKTGKEIFWKGGERLNIGNVEFTYGNNPKKFNLSNLKIEELKFGKGQKTIFNELFTKHGQFYDLMDKVVDDPFRKGKSIKFGELMKKVYKTPVAMTMDHGFSVREKPFTGLNIMSHRMNEALSKVYEYIPDKKAKSLLTKQIMGNLKNFTGANYLSALEQGQYDIAKKIAKEGRKTVFPTTAYKIAGLDIMKSKGFASLPVKTKLSIAQAGLGKESREWKHLSELYQKKDFKSFKNALYKQFPDFVKKCGLKKAEGGRIGFASGTQSFDDCMRGAIADETRVAKGFGANAQKAMQRLGGVAKWAGKWIGLIDVPIEFAFALPALLRGDIEGAKRHTTFGLFGWGETQMEQMKETNPEAYKFLKHDNDIMNWQQAEWQLEHLNEAKERLEKMNVSGYGTNELNQINTQIEELLAKQTNIEENYIGYEYTDEVALGKQMLGSYVKNEADRHREARDRGEVLGMQKPIVDEAFGELTPTSIRPEKEREAVEYPDTYGGYLMKKQFDKTEGRYREDPIIEALIEEGPYMEVDEWRKRYMPKVFGDSPGYLNARFGRKEIEDYNRAVQSAQGSPGFNYAGFAGGGIAGIRRPWAIPPESGPMPQGGGLSSQFNRVKKLTG